MADRPYETRLYQLSGPFDCRRRIVLAAIAVGSLLSGPTQAAVLQAFSGVVGGAGNGSIAGGCTTYGPPAQLAFFGGAAAQLQVQGGNAACGYSGGFTNLTSAATTPLFNSASLAPTVLGVPGFAESFDGTAKSRASFGSLSADAHGNYSGSPAGYTPGTTIAAATAASTFSDTFTASVSNAVTDVSTAGFVRYRFSINGTLSAPGTPAPFLDGEALTAFDIQQDNGPIYSLFSAQTSTGAIGTFGGATAGWTISPGLITGASTVESQLFSIDLLTSWDFTAGLIVNAFGNADDDFFSTVKLTGLDLFDSQGNAISNFSLRSASGTDYLGTAAVGVPEPPVVALIFAGLLVLPLGGWRRAAGRINHAIGAFAARPAGAPCIPAMAGARG